MNKATAVPSNMVNLASTGSKKRCSVILFIVISFQEEIFRLLVTVTPELAFGKPEADSAAAIMGPRLPEQLAVPTESMMDAGPA